MKQGKLEISVNANEICMIEAMVGEQWKLSSRQADSCGTMPSIVKHT